MIPLRDTQEIKIFPIATIAIIAVNTMVLILMQISSARAADPSLWLESFYLRYGLVPYEIMTGDIIYPSIRPVFLTLFTSIFLHGGWSHLIGNMLYLWIFGNNVEDYLGTFGFIAFYLAGGIAATFAHIASAPASQVPVVGASGAIAGVMGAYFYLFPHARVRTLVLVFYFVTFVEIPAYFFLFIWFIMQLSSAFTSFGSASGVAFWAHVGGFVFGFLVALLVKKLKHGRERSEYF